MAKKKVTLPAVKIEAIQKDFEVATEYIQIIKDANFEIWPGEFIILSGPSGSGKSTLLHLMAGWELPTRGSVSISGVNVTEMGENQRTKFLRGRVSLVNQSPFWINSLDTIENIAIPCLVNRKGKKESLARAHELAQILGIDELLTYNPADLSGGQQQRVNLLRALITNPDIILADEPTGNLDSHASEFVVDFLRTINRRLKRTVIMATHDERLLQYATRVIYIKDGKILKIETNDKNFVSSPSQGDITDLEKLHFSSAEKGWLK